MSIQQIIRQELNRPDAGQPEHTFIWVPVGHDGKRKLALELDEPNTQLASETSILVNKQSVNDYLGLEPGTFGISIRTTAYGKSDKPYKLVIIYPKCHFSLKPRPDDQVEILAYNTLDGMQGEPLEGAPREGFCYYIDWLKSEA